MPKQSLTNFAEPNLSTFKPKHLELMAYARHPRVENLLAVGGLRSGKTITFATEIILRALEAAGSRHGVFHAYGTVCDRNLFELSFPQAFEIIMPGYWAALAGDKRVNRINKTDRIITLPNDAKIMFFGLGDPNKIRGQEFCTIFLNEANRDIDYDAVTTLQGRLSQKAFKLDGTPLAHKFFADINPTVKSSWEYQTFVEGLVPGDRSPLPDRKSWKWLRVNPHDNADNLPEGYIAKRFSGMSAEKQHRDLHGLWSDDNPNALFDAKTIGRRHAEIEDMVAIVVALDPAGTSTNKSDSTGVIVAGKDAEGRYYVFEDATLKAKPDVWINHAETLRTKYDANWIVSEKDYGQDLLIELVARTIPNAPVKYVPSRGRGKRLRAEPIAALYAQGLVNHVPAMIEVEGRLVGDPNRAMQFHALEQQMVEFDSPGFKGSPDRVDALVYALQQLSEIGTEPSGATSLPTTGFWRR